MLNFSRSANQRLRIIVLGYIVRGPLGGLAWHHLQYVLGLARLGHDVYFLEDSDDYPSCSNPERDTLGTDPTYGLQFIRNVFARLGLTERWAYYDAHTGRWFGSAAEQILDRCATAELLLNISGVNPLRAWCQQIPARALIDTDPAFTQIRHLTDSAANSLAQQHTSFFTFAENIAHGTARLPNDGFPWQPTRQPIVTAAWPVTAGIKQGKWTTVMQWDSYATREYDGQKYGMKSDSFAEYMSLPEITGDHFELAVGGRTAPRELLTAQGWQVLDPRLPTRDPWTYQKYIAQSKAEFSVAKHGYVISHSGWFSERSAAYLASGRPVLTQDTGFSEWLPTGAGILAFKSRAEALAGLAEINQRYEFHCHAAREIASSYFDSDQVLTELIERAMS